MDDLLNEYKAYYRVRANRYQGNPNYKHSYEAESNLSAAMQSCNELIEFKDKIGNLNELCALALIKDQYLQEQAHFRKHQEVIRQKAADDILNMIDQQSGVQEAMTMVQDVEQKVSIEISMDEAHRHFQGEWKSMDDLEIYERAQVPEQYKADYNRRAQELKSKLNENVTDLEKQSGDWKEGWRFNPSLNLEYRHRRLIPYSDQDLNNMLSKYKSIVNR